MTPLLVHGGAGQRTPLRNRSTSRGISSASLPERREADRHDIESVVEVFPKVSLLDRFFKIAIGGRDDPGIDV